MKINPQGGTLDQEQIINTMQRPRAVVSQCWHMDLAQAKGWESEPDEHRRTRSRFARHYTRPESPVVNLHTPRSTSVHIAQHKLPSSSRWHDLLPETIANRNLWEGFD